MKVVVSNPVALLSFLVVACGPTPPSPGPATPAAPAAAKPEPAPQPAATPEARPARRELFLIDQAKVFPLACWDEATRAWMTTAACAAAHPPHSQLELAGQTYQVEEVIDETDDMHDVERHGLRLDRNGPDETYALSGVPHGRLLYDFGDTNPLYVDAPGPVTLDPATARAIAAGIGVAVEEVDFMQAESVDVDHDGKADLVVSAYAHTDGDPEEYLDHQGSVFVVTAGAPPVAVELDYEDGASLRVRGAFDLNDDGVLELWTHRFRDTYDDDVLVTVDHQKARVLGTYCCD